MWRSKIKRKEKTASTPLVTVSDLQRLNQFEIIVLRRRMFPYKTRFQTDFEVDWGRTYPNETPPERQRRELQLFDIRDFVKKQKEEKLKEMGTFEPSINPFGSGASPFMGNPFMSQNPFMNMPNFVNENNDIPEKEEKFNIDDLVKKIDAKMAEIEREEQSANNVIDVKPEEESTQVNPPETKQPEKQPAPTEQNNQIQHMYEDNTSDDDFFDDFFSDD